MLLAITNDLMASAPIEHAARRLDLACQVVSSTSLIGLALQTSPQVVILDLTATDDVATLVSDIRRIAGTQTPIVAFGPHVHESKLEAAREAGCADVLTRGQFHRDTAGTIEKHLRDGA